MTLSAAGREKGIAGVSVVGFEQRTARRYHLRGSRRITAGCANVNGARGRLSAGLFARQLRSLAMGAGPYRIAFVIPRSAQTVDALWQGGGRILAKSGGAAG